MENTEKVYVICGTQGKGLTYFSTQSHKDRENGKMGGEERQEKHLQREQLRIFKTDKTSTHKFKKLCKPKQEI